MKRMFCLLVVALVVLQASLSFANPSDRFQMGARHIFYSHKQIIEGLRTEPPKAKFVPFGYAGGVIKGTGFMARDIIQGIFEILTCVLDHNKQR